MAKVAGRELDPRGIAPRHKNLKRVLEDRHITRNMFAGWMGVSGNTVDRWLDGAKSAGQTISNAKLAECAFKLRLSPWFILDICSEPDGSDARPLMVYENMVITCGWLKLEDNGATWVDGGERLHFFRFTDESRELAWADSAQLDRPSILATMAAAAASANGKEIMSHQEEAATAGEAEYLAWFKRRVGERFEEDLMALRGDFRNPRGVLDAILEYAMRDGHGRALDPALVEMGRLASQAPIAD